MTQERKPFLWIQNIVNWALTKPKSALVFTLALVFASLLGLPKLKLELDLYDSYNPDFPSLVKLLELREEFQDSSSLYILAEWPQSPNGQQLCEFLRKLDQIQAGQSETKSVYHIFKARYVKQETDRYWYPTLLQDPCLDTQKSLSQHLENWDSQVPFQMVQVGPNELVVQVQFENNFEIQSAQNWIEEIQSSEYKTSFVGPTTFRYYLHKTIQSDSFLHIFLILFFIVFIRAFLGTWRMGLFYIFTLMGTSMCLAGFMGLLGYPIDVLSNNLFLLTAVAGTADFLFVSWGLKQGKSLNESFKRYSRPCFFTTLTTMIGFLSLLTSDLDIIQRFGVAAAIGAALEWIFTLVTLPALLKVLRLEKNLVKTKPSGWLTKSIQFSKWTPNTTFTLAFVTLSAAAPFLFTNLRFEENPLKNFPKDHPVSISHRNFIDKSGWQGALHLAFPKSTPQIEIEACLNNLKQSSLIHQIENPYKVRDYYLKELSPLRAATVEQNLMQYGVLKSFFGSNSIRAPVFLKETSPIALEKLNSEVKTNCTTNASLVGQSEVYREVSTLLSHTLTDSFVSSLILVLLIVFGLQLKLGNRDYATVAISILAGPFAMITLMALFDVAISPMNSLFLAVLVGITGDNAIQYLFATETSNLDDGVAEVGTASIVIGVLMVISSLFFLLQTLIPMKTLGILFSTGFLLNLLGDLWLLKGLLRIKNYLMKRSIGPKIEPDPKA